MGIARLHHNIRHDEHHAIVLLPRSQRDYSEVEGYLQRLDTGHPVSVNGLTQAQHLIGWTETTFGVSSTPRMLSYHASQALLKERNHTNT